MYRLSYERRGDISFIARRDDIIFCHEWAQRTRYILLLSFYRVSTCFHPPNWHDVILFHLTSSVILCFLFVLIELYFTLWNLNSFTKNEKWNQRRNEEEKPKALPMMLRRTELHHVILADGNKCWPFYRSQWNEYNWNHCYLWQKHEAKFCVLLHPDTRVWVKCHASQLRDNPTNFRELIMRSDAYDKLVFVQCEKCFFWPERK